MSPRSKKQAPRVPPAALADLATDVFGLRVSDERAAVLARELETVLVLLRGLRELDLGDTLPVVLFDPLTAYQEQDDGEGNP